MHLVILVIKHNDKQWCEILYYDIEKPVSAINTHLLVTTVTVELSSVTGCYDIEKPVSAINTHPLVTTVTVELSSVTG